MWRSGVAPKTEEDDRLAPQVMEALCQHWARLAAPDLIVVEATRGLERPLPDADRQALRALVVRRWQLTAMCAREQNHLASADPSHQPHRFGNLRVNTTYKLLNS